MRPTAILRATFRESFTDRTFMVAGGLAFFALFSVLPAIAVMGLAITLIVGVDDLEAQLRAADDALPEGTRALLAEFLVTVPNRLVAGLGLSVNLVIVFWTVQRAASGLLTALNVVYDEDEKRRRLRRELVAVALAGAGMLFLFVTLFVALVMPVLAGGGALPGILATVRWPALAALFFAGLCLLYAHAPARPDWHWPSVVIGAAAATAIWVASTFLFAVYMDVIGGWEAYYGSLTSGVVLMTWMFISAFVVMFGAELDSQIHAAARGVPADGTKAALRRRQRAEDAEPARRSGG